LGRIIREVERHAESPSAKLDKLLQTAHRIYAQQRHDMNNFCSVHEPEVECIAKGKAGKQHEFGNKVSVAVSGRGRWLVGAQSFTGNPYDGHTLAAQMKQAENLIANEASEMYADMGCRGHDYDGVVHVHVDRVEGLAPQGIHARRRCAYLCAVRSQGSAGPNQLAVHLHHAHVPMSSGRASN
jgi:IS5 family transposase